jgi:hypothetical protein
LKDLEAARRNNPLTYEYGKLTGQVAGMLTGETEVNLAKKLAEKAGVKGLEKLAGSKALSVIQKASPWQWAERAVPKALTTATEGYGLLNTAKAASKAGLASGIRLGSMGAISGATHGAADAIDEGSGTWGTIGSSAVGAGKGALDMLTQTIPIPGTDLSVPLALIPPLATAVSRSGLAKDLVMGDRRAKLDKYLQDNEFKRLSGKMDVGGERTATDILLQTKQSAGTLNTGDYNESVRRGENLDAVKHLKSLGVDLSKSENAVNDLIPKTKEAIEADAKTLDTLLETK